MAAIATRSAELIVALSEFHEAALFLEAQKIMPRNNRDEKQKNLCPLTTSKRKRAAANKLVATVKDGFPPGVGQPALRALASAGYTSLDQLTSANEKDLAALHGMGPKALGILRSALQAKGKSFRA